MESRIGIAAALHLAVALGSDIVPYLDLDGHMLGERRRICVGRLHPRARHPHARPKRAGLGRHAASIAAMSGGSGWRRSIRPRAGRCRSVRRRRAHHRGGQVNHRFAHAAPPANSAGRATAPDSSSRPSVRRQYTHSPPHKSDGDSGDGGMGAFIGRDGDDHQHQQRGKDRLQHERRAGVHMGNVRSISRAGKRASPSPQRQSRPRPAPKHSREPRATESSVPARNATVTAGLKCAIETCPNV